MTLELWLAFVAASGVLVVIPGPTVLLVVAYAIGEGRRSALATTLGVALGDLVAMTLSMAGVGALIAASSDLYTALKWMGALYLIWLGVQLWRAPVRSPQAIAAAEPCPAGRMIGHALLVTALNPKGIVFFIAFVPQFIRPEAAFLPQAAILIATFVVVAVANVLAYALLAGGLRDMIRRPSTLRTLNRLGAGALVAAGVVTLALRRSG